MRRPPVAFFPLSPSQWLVALLGIAQRQIQVKFAQSPRKGKQPNPLSTSTKTLGAWIQEARQAKNLAAHHLAAKMGIATALVQSWEADDCEPNDQQRQILNRFLTCFQLPTSFTSQQETQVDVVEFGHTPPHDHVAGGRIGGPVEITAEPRDFY